MVVARGVGRHTENRDPEYINAGAWWAEYNFLGCQRSATEKKKKNRKRKNALGTCIIFIQMFFSRIFFFFFLFKF